MVSSSDNAVTRKYDGASPVKRGTPLGQSLTLGVLFYVFRPGAIGEGVSHGAAGRSVTAGRVRAINMAVGVSQSPSPRGGMLSALSYGRLCGRYVLGVVAVLTSSSTISWCASTRNHVSLNYLLRLFTRIMQQMFKPVFILFYFFSYHFMSRDVPN